MIEMAGRLRGRRLTALLMASLCFAPMVVTRAEADAQAASRSWEDGTGKSISGKTNVERSIGKCVASVLGGALLGALVGAAAGDGKKGALIGAGVGVGVCAVLMKVASDKDKALVRSVQLNAANLGQQQYSDWVNSDGASIRTVVDPSATVPLVVNDKTAYKCRTDKTCLVGDKWVPYQSLVQADGSGTMQPASGSTQVLKCRRIATQVTVDGQQATGASGTEAVCLVGDNWLTMDKLKKMNIKDDDIVA